MTSLTTSSKRDMCAPFCWGPRSTKHSRRAEKSCSSPFWRMRTIFSISVTPTRDRLTRRFGVCAWTSVSRALRLCGMRPAYRADLPNPALAAPRSCAITHKPLF